MATEQFYRDLKPVASLAVIFSEECTKPLPQDWLVVITDVVGSTRAIADGRYKDVNTAGGLAAMAMSNAFHTLEFPFIFGGDGTTFLIPPSLESDARSILADTARKVFQFFQLELRVGIVPAHELYAKGHFISVGKISVSEYYTQAVILGEGIDFAEKWIKGSADYLVPPDFVGKKEADFFGFSCRWHDIPSRGGETVALIVRLNANQEKTNRELLKQLLDRIEKIYGPESEHHPLSEETLKPALSPRVLWREACARTQKKSGIRYRLLLMRLMFEIIATKLIVALSLPGRYFHYKIKDIKKYNILSADYKKFDGMLKLVLNGTPAMREALVAFLNELKSGGKLLYGIHVSNRALLTCLLNAESVHEVHFVDAADGGYALAAKMLKDELRAQ